MTKFYSIIGNCQYSNCPLKAEVGWSNKLYCLFHYKILRRARSNRLKKLNAEKLERNTYSQEEKKL